MNRHHIIRSMGNTETRVSSDIASPSFQASSSTSKRLRLVDNHSDGYQSRQDKEVAKNMEEILIGTDLVSEKLDSFVDKPSAEAKELSSLKAVVHRHLTCTSCGQLPRVRPLMLCASGHVTCASCYHLSHSLLQCTESDCQLHVTEHPSSGQGFLHFLAPTGAQEMLISVRSFGSNLSRAVNLHFSRSESNQSTLRAEGSENTQSDQKVVFEHLIIN